MCISVKLEAHNFVLQTFGAKNELVRHADINIGDTIGQQHAGNND